jgi:anti-sigma B factor antagonist
LTDRSVFDRKTVLSTSILGEEGQFDAEESSSPAWRSKVNRPEGSGRPQDEDSRAAELQERAHAPEFGAKVDARDSVTYIELLGELDLSCEGRFGKAVDTVRSGRLVLDLRRLTFIDSTGLRLIIRTWERSRADGFDLKIVGGEDQVAKIFQVTGLDNTLPIVDKASLNGDVPYSGSDSR